MGLVDGQKVRVSLMLKKQFPQQPIATEMIDGTVPVTFICPPLPIRAQRTIYNHGC
jgi:hypothetical protein